MMQKVFSVLDTKLATFGRPWFHMTDASAIREFSDAVNDGSNVQNQWYRHPEDFSLYCVGSFDDQSGELIPCLPLSLVTASAVFRYTPSSGEREFFDKNGSKKEPVIN
jgi:hypothetical protein